MTGGEIMCYLIVRDVSNVGSIALKIEHGSKLAVLSKQLTKATIDSGHIEVLTINNLDVYKEYGPYSIFDNESDFVNEVLSLM